METIIVVTPTYNRKKLLPRLYKSLINQTNKEFKWIVIDDGSTDGTDKYMMSLIKQKEIKIEYYRKENGGKASALNYVFDIVDEESLLTIIDSDDYLLPDSIDIISKYLKKYRTNEEVGAFFFHYQFEDGLVLRNTNKQLTNDELLTRYEYNNKYGKHDGCIAYFGRVIKEYQYPSYENENYVGPTVIQMEMADQYKILFSPEVVGVAEYQDGGLSKSGRKLRLNNPKGMIHYGRLLITNKSPLKTRLKYSVSIWPYAKLDNKTFVDLFRESNNPFLLLLSYIPGKFLTYLWKRNI